jgi:hypothetical protein
LESSFFGLTLNYRKSIWIEIHDLVYHGNGGFIHSEVYDMPIWLRKFHISQINKFHKKQDEEMKKAQGQSDMGDGKIKRPNINPSSVYNFNK